VIVLFGPAVRLDAAIAGLPEAAPTDTSTGGLKAFTPAGNAPSNEAGVEYEKPGTGEVLVGRSGSGCDWYAPIYDEDNKTRGSRDSMIALANVRSERRWDLPNRERSPTSPLHRVALAAAM